MATKIFRKLNDEALKETWTGVLESYGATPEIQAKRPWLVDMAHYHAIFDNSGIVNEAATGPGLFLQQPGSVSAMGNIVAPVYTQTPFSGFGTGTITKGNYADSGSGDKFPSLLPVAIQVAAKTIGFDLVGVVPMDAPVGFLPYLDYVYMGGNIDTGYSPFTVKLTGLTGGELTALTTQSTPGVYDQITQGDFKWQFYGYSRVDGKPMVRVITENDDTTTTLASAIAAAYGSDVIVELVSALENHVSGFTSISDADYANAANNFNGPYLGDNGTQMEGMVREVAEVSKFRQMGLKMFTKFIEAKGDQVAISATVEQIQDLNRVWNFDVISMLENVAVNEVAQSINKKLVDRVFVLGAKHATNVNTIEGAGITTLDLTVGSGFENISTLQRRVVTKILEMANLIYHRGRFGAGTHIVTNGRVASALADVAGYTFAPFNNDLPSGPGQLYPAGKVHGLTVYVDPNLKFGDNRIHIGRKGADEEPGVKFLPYIMAESLQTIAEGTFSPKIGLKSRYAITEAGWHPETQYITLTVNGLGVLTGSVAPSTAY